MSEPESEILVEVAYARPEEQVLIPLRVPAGTTLEDAIRQSGVLQRFEEIDLANQKVGIFGRIAPKSRVLQDRDRVEIYRPLIADPKAVRRERAKKTAAKTAE